MDTVTGLEWIQIVVQNLVQLFTYVLGSTTLVVTVLILTLLGFALSLVFRKVR